MADPVPATAWIDEAPHMEGDDVTAHAELTDVDEVAVVIREPTVDVTTGAPDSIEVAIIHMDRVHAIALAGQIAAAATASQTELPRGHVDA